MTKDKNLLLNQFKGDNNFSIAEKIPPLSNDLNDVKFLTFGEDIIWSSIKSTNGIILTQDSSGDLTIDMSVNTFEGTDMYFKNGQVGIGRNPLHNYKLDIGVSVNTQSTALHIGDGTFGFSLGNATVDGFLPQIIGMGSSYDDAGLYFLGKVSSSESSNIPALIFDGRDYNNNPLENRPIMGISSGSYTEYKFLIDQHGDVEVSGKIKADNIEYIDGSGLIQNLRNEIEYLKTRLTALEQN